MNWDLATILVLLIATSGAIWLYDTLLFSPKRKIAKANLSEHASETDRLNASQVPFLVDLSRSLFPVFVIVLILRSFLIEPFRIPSGSMMPTLLIGDFILVNKFCYGLRLPVANYKVIEINKPQRGDVVVFRYPEDPSIPFIKRVVGLPGDHLVYNIQTKVLYINNQPVEQKMVGIYKGLGAGSNMTGSEERVELLPTTKSTPVEHTILTMPRHQSDSPIKEMTIPAGEYFVLGDNRDNSRDSRYWGTVPEENLIGRAFFIWMNWDLANGGVNWRRLGTTIQ
jgi:signal peptidase I